MTTAVLPGHRDGLLQVAVGRDGSGTTCLRRLHQRFPLRTTVPFYLDPHDDGMAFVYVQNPTGGVFEGDRLHTDVTLAPGARLHVTTQSATKIFAMGEDHAEQHLDFRVGDDAYLEHVPDMIIPHATARLRQRVRVELGRDATYVGSEVIAPGRVARGERFGYHWVHAETAVHRDGRELCVDAVRIEPRTTPPGAPGLLAGTAYMVSLLVAAPERTPDGLVERLDHLAASAAGSGGCGGAGELPRGAGVVVRALAPDARSARATVEACWAQARRELLDLPLPRVRK